MLKIIKENTQIYQKSTKKLDRKKKGQFFTPLEVGIYMSEMSKNRFKKMKILDCGAGTGILGLALVKELLDDEIVKEVEIDFYENDNEIISVLEENISEAMKYIKLKNKVLKYKIINENFITYNKEFWQDKTFNGIYDIVISNPPYKKLAKDSEESKAVSEIVFGQPNIYFIFMAISAHLLKRGGEMIFITPRSFTSGAYFKKFRAYLLENTAILSIHIFNSRNDVFEGEEVLQEAIITRCVKNNELNDIEIISTNHSNFDEKEVINIPYSTVVNMECDNKFILIPSNEEEVTILNVINKWTNNLISLGFKLKTGPVVDFRATEFLTNNFSQDGIVPLIWSDNFIENTIEKVDNNNNFRYVLNSEESKGILLDSQNYLLVKRFAAKEEKRRIQVAIYLKDSFEEYNKIGIENHINYITKLKGSIEREELFGLFCLFNSTIIDKYYRIVNGNTQVNATEANAIPLPKLDIIKKIGMEVINISINSLTTERCDEIINRFNGF